MSYGGRNDSFGPKPVETGREYDVTDHRNKPQRRRDCKNTRICYLCKGGKGRSEREDPD